MRITFLGAAGEVTGSAYFIRTANAAILVDFGAFQGGKGVGLKNSKFPPINFNDLNAVVITHAHLDHTGRLPLLIKRGYKKPIFATQATIELTRLILLDSAKVQESEIKRTNRKRSRSGLSPLEPEYELQDIENLMKEMVPVPYRNPVEIAQGIIMEAREAGHTLGSASYRLIITEEGQKKEIVFSGDLGPHGMAIMKDPEPFESADVIIMESTYGDHDHKSLEQTLKESGEIVKNAIKKKSKVLVPSFAIGRTQQLLFYLARAVEQGAFPAMKVYLDSPMAIEASRLYLSHKELFDEEMMELVKSGSVKGDLSRINVTETAEESKAINDVPGPCMIIAGAGMCNAGRILHHLRHNLWNPDTTVMIIGYQAQGTLGRKLVDGFKKVRIFGEDIAVHAKIATMNGLSAHAGQTDLLKWFGAMAKSKPKLILTHGEEKARESLAEKVNNMYGINPLLPKFGETIEL